MKHTVCHSLLFAATAAVLFCVTSAAHAKVLRSAAEIEALPGVAESAALPFDIRATVAAPESADLSDCNTFIVFDHSGGTLLQTT